MAQLHKKFADSQIKELMKRYLNKEIKGKYIQEILGVKKRRFLALAAKYKENPEKFSIQYSRKSPSKIPQSTEKNIIRELLIDKKIIENKDIPLKSYNYSYIKKRLETQYKQKVSLPTIIDRAKKNDFYLKKKRKKAKHDREVLTNYVGELHQHDSSLHLWAPSAKQKWYLITTIDDHSRYMLYATLLEKESSWAHIYAAQIVILKYGVPLSYYVDCHSIFRFIQGRDSVWRKHYLFTDDADPQWKQVMIDCNIKVIPALSPQAKGKVERPYGWIQDHLVRTCVRENVSTLKQAQYVLNREVHQYNHKQIHSTTMEIPYIRFQRALKEGRSLYREFKVPPPYESVKDVFCLRMDRTIDAYRKISLKTLQLKITNAKPHEKVNLRIYPLNRTVSEVRIWSNNKLIDVKTVKNADLKGVHF